MEERTQAPALPTDAVEGVRYFFIPYGAAAKSSGLRVGMEQPYRRSRAGLLDREKRQR